MDVQNRENGPIFCFILLGLEMKDEWTNSTHTEKPLLTHLLTSENLLLREEKNESTCIDHYLIVM